MHPQALSARELLLQALPYHSRLASGSPGASPLGLFLAAQGSVCGRKGGRRSAPQAPSLVAPRRGAPLPSWLRCSPPPSSRAWEGLLVCPFARLRREVAQPSFRFGVACQRRRVCARAAPGASLPLPGRGGGGVFAPRPPPQRWCPGRLPSPQAHLLQGSQSSFALAVGGGPRVAGLPDALGAVCRQHCPEEKKEAEPQ